MLGDAHIGTPWRTAPGWAGGGLFDQGGAHNGVFEVLDRSIQIVNRWKQVMPSLFRQELRRRRLRLGLSRDQLAHSVGVPPAMILAWEEDTAEIACPNALRQILQQSNEPWSSSDSTN